jgi:ribosomal protein S18 acetylase RimI-like enzyme
VVEHGALRRVPRRLEIPAWDAGELAETERRIEASLAAGGVLLGVTEGASLVAGAVLGGTFLSSAPDRLELVFLHVSRPYRRRGLATELLGEVCRRARARGAEQLYISSSDAESAVRFYLRRGGRLSGRVDREIAARWPEDVPLELDL